jgi:hypothetical protein
MRLRGFCWPVVAAQTLLVTQGSDLPYANRGFHFVLLSLLMQVGGTGCGTAKHLLKRYRKADMLRKLATSNRAVSRSLKPLFSWVPSFYQGFHDGTSPSFYNFQLLFH